MPFPVEHLLIIFYRNGIRKFDIFHQVFQSFLLVSYISSYASIRDLILILNVLSILGTKSDLRIPNSEKFVTQSEGKRLRQKIKAYALVECSAKKKLNLEDVFHEAVRAVEKKPHVKSNSCVLL